MSWSGVTSFPGFTWPKTTVQPETERGLTSEFGMGSGGTRALWPANPRLHGDFVLISLSLLCGGFLLCVWFALFFWCAIIHIFGLCHVILTRVGS